MPISESGKPSPNPTLRKWYVADQGTTKGPYPESQVVAAIRKGQIPSSTLVCPEGDHEWRPAHSYSTLVDGMPPPPPPSAPVTQMRSAPVPKTRTENLILWHRLFTWGFMGIIAGYLVAMSVGDAVPALGILILFSVWIASGVLTGGLSRACGSPLFWLWGIVGLLPYLGAFALFFVSRGATKQLKAAGVKVGLFGPVTP